MSGRRSSQPPLFEALVLFNSDAVEDTELSVKKGDIVYVKEIIDDGWALAKHKDKPDSRSGWVPLDFLEKIEVGVTESNSESIPEPLQADVEIVPEPIPLSASKVNEIKEDTEPTPEKLKEVQDALSKINAAVNIDIVDCFKCSQKITDRRVEAAGKPYHPDCFTCTTCSKSLLGTPFKEKDEKPYCQEDFSQFLPKCGECGERIEDTFITALGKTFHPEHFKCEECKKPFDSEMFHNHEDKPFCDPCFKNKFGTLCSKCGKSIDGQFYESMEKKFHVECYTCAVGDHQLGQMAVYSYEDKMYCKDHFEEMFMKKCGKCNKTISERYVTIKDKTFHPDCWTCSDCDTPLSSQSVHPSGDKFLCGKCYKGADAKVEKVLQDVEKKKQEFSKPKKPEYAKPISTPDRPSNPPPSSTEETGKSVLKAINEEVEPEDSLGQEYYSLSALQNPDTLPPHLDKTKREIYVEPELFKELFKMTKEEFSKLVAWKQKKLKRELGLF